MDSTKTAAEQTLAALDLPLPDDLAQRLAGVPEHDVWRHAGRLVTEQAARELWRRWNPERAQRAEDPRFLARFRRLMADGVELGYRLERFREISARLPDPGATGRSWIPLFEEAIAGDDCGVVRLFLSREQHQELRAWQAQGSEKHETWDEMLSMLNDGLFYELGLVFRPVAVQVDEALSPPWFRCEWNDLRLPPRRGLEAHSLLVNDTPDRLTLLNLQATAATNPATGAECAIIDRSMKGTVEQAGLTTWDARGYVVLALSAAIRDAAPGLAGRPLHDLFTVRMRDFSPDLMSTLEAALPRDFVLQILRGLLAEGISVRDLSAIFEALLELRAVAHVDTGTLIVFGPPTGGVFPNAMKKQLSELGAEDHVELVRWSLKRYISHKYTRGGNTLVVYLVDPEIERLLASPGELEASVEEPILAAVRSELGSLPPTAQAPVILTASEGRRRLRRVLQATLPHVAVLSYQELSPDMNIQPIARISLD